MAGINTIIQMKRGKSSLMRDSVSHVNGENEWTNSMPANLTDNSRRSVSKPAIRLHSLKHNTNSSIATYRRLVSLLLVFLGLSLAAHILLLFHSYNPKHLRRISSALTNTLLCSVSDLPFALRKLAKCGRTKSMFLENSDIVPTYFLYEPPPLLLTDVGVEEVAMPSFIRSSLFSFSYEAEARAALHAAQKLRIRGNLRRARAVIEHAYSLAPNHPDILTEYGVFVEIAQKDVVAAESFYLKALIHDPTHSEALVRRDRTLPLVEEIDSRVLSEIYKKRDIFLKIPRSDPGLRRAMRDSYFSHVYHTVAMEGNTLNLVQTRSILETRVAVGGKSILEHNEILGMDAALRFLNQTLSDLSEITVDDILAIHKRILGFADPMAAGVIRHSQVYVGSFTPTSPDKIAEEMEALVDWLNDEETYSRLDPIKIAAIAHYKLVYIHPFVDGNGRTSRLLMNFILMRAGFPPVIIPVEQRQRYYKTLQDANAGDLRPFIRFIAEQTDLALEGFISSTTLTSAGDNEKCSIIGQNRIDIGPDSLVYAEAILN